jgi:hypothetical protein
LETADDADFTGLCEEYVYGNPDDVDDDDGCYDMVYTYERERERDHEREGIIHLFTYLY